MKKTKYNLFTFFDKLKEDWQYLRLKESINNHDGNQVIVGFKLPDGTIAKVYSAEMWFLLTNDSFKNNGFEDAYCRGFEDGRIFINDKIDKALNGFYKSCTTDYINELNYAYFSKAENYLKGYKNGACSYPILFYVNDIEKIGFASGVVAYVDLMAQENPLLFLGFYKENNSTILNADANPYPKIFKDYRAFTIFNNLLNEFGNTAENLSNYSFVFHKMTYEDLIHFDLKQQSFFDILDEFDITISRIKPLSDIGKIAYRESIYAKAK